MWAGNDAELKPILSIGVKAWMTAGNQSPASRASRCTLHRSSLWSWLGTVGFMAWLDTCVRKRCWLRWLRVRRRVCCSFMPWCWSRPRKFVRPAHFVRINRYVHPDRCGGNQQCLWTLRSWKSQTGEKHFATRCLAMLQMVWQFFAHWCLGIAGNVSSGRLVPNFMAYNSRICLWYWQRNCCWS